VVVYYPGISASYLRDGRRGQRLAGAAELTSPRPSARVEPCPDVIECCYWAVLVRVARCGPGRFGRYPTNRDLKCPRSACASLLEETYAGSVPIVIQTDLKQFILRRTSDGNESEDAVANGGNGNEGQPDPSVDEDTNAGPDFDNLSVSLGAAALDIEDVLDDGSVVVECDVGLLGTATFVDFPPGLVLRIHSPDGFGTFLFHEAEIFRNDSGVLIGEFTCHHPNKYWDGTWGLAKLLGAVRDQVAHHLGVSVVEIELEDDWKRLSLRIPLAEESASSSLQARCATLQKLIREAEIALGGIQWKSDYATNERAFCEEILAPLLRRMGFLSVRYTQGPREFGRDFTFSELTPFGFLRHYGLQAKAGDVSGNVNSSVDELVGQADDSFKIPYIDVGSTEPRFISTFVIAISGRFTAYSARPGHLFRWDLGSRSGPPGRIGAERRPEWPGSGTTSARRSVWGWVDQRVAGLVAWVPFLSRIEGPWRARTWALWTRRSQMASARVGSLRSSCQRLVGICELMTVEE
jgi:hypothetical protein